ncbi:hypothetical protein [Paraliomyxa miuraensis]|uniref:hypothetical protein n=1 Tax=Paraliomyxa miuraensis TaxID=376150 RepID=UPI00225C0BDB|nr:hypothetical protein [Paraliomyxa miuraensis]MCX4247413.1 hypothetical protein [Paraliomyxa miuraensis]
MLATSLSPIVGGCHRDPGGPCAYEDVEISPQSFLPWGTTLEQDMAWLAEPRRGVLAWWDGEDVVMVPRAGQELPVDAIAEIDPTTARIREFERLRGSRVCESDTLLVEARVSFVRLDDGEVELSTPVTISREGDDSRYYGESIDLAIMDLDPGLVPLMSFQTEEIWTSMVWSEDGMFSAEYDYYGSSTDSTDSTSTGHGTSKLVAEFSMPQ